MSILDHKLPIYLNFQSLFLKMKIEDTGLPYSKAYTVLTCDPPIPQYNGLVLYIEDNIDRSKWKCIHRDRTLDGVLREINRLFNKSPNDDIEWISQYIVDPDKLGINYE